MFGILNFAERRQCGVQRAAFRKSLLQQGFESPLHREAAVIWNLPQSGPKRQGAINPDHRVLIKSSNHLPHFFFSNRSNLVHHDLTGFLQTVFHGSYHLEPKQGRVLQMARDGTYHQAAVRRIGQISLNHYGRPRFAGVS